MSRFAGFSGHSPKSQTVEWLTPLGWLAQLGPFDLDPCGTEALRWHTAARILTRRDDGLTARWEPDERTWLNPPYTDGVVGRWLARLADHGRGTALIFARTDTEAFHRHVFGRAHAVLFMAGRMTFHFGRRFRNKRTGRVYEIGERAPKNAGAPTILCAYGQRDADILAECGIAGQFFPLLIPRSVLVAALRADAETWAELVRAVAGTIDGPISVDAVYRRLMGHPKAERNRHVRAKVRQQLQLGFDRVGRGEYARRA